MSEISVKLWPEEATRTPDRACYYVAEAVIDGHTYRGRSRYGAVFELCRVTRDAGIADAPICITHAGLAGYSSYASFRAAAQWTISENRTSGPRRVRWVDPAGYFAERRSPDPTPPAKIDAGAPPLPVHGGEAADPPRLTSKPVPPVKRRFLHPQRLGWLPARAAADGPLRHPPFAALAPRPTGRRSRARPQGRADPPLAARVPAAHQALDGGTPQAPPPASGAQARLVAANPAAQAQIA